MSRYMPQENLLTVSNFIDATKTLVYSVTDVVTTGCEGTPNPVDENVDPYDEQLENCTDSERQTKMAAVTACRADADCLSIMLSFAAEDLSQLSTCMAQPICGAAMQPCAAG